MAAIMLAVIILLIGNRDRLKRSGIRRFTDIARTLLDPEFPVTLFRCGNIKAEPFDNAAHLLHLLGIATSAELARADPEAVFQPDPELRPIARRHGRDRHLGCARRQARTSGNPIRTAGRQCVRICATSSGMRTESQL